MSFSSGLVALTLCLAVGTCHAQTKPAGPATPARKAGQPREAAALAWLDDMQAQVGKASVYGQPWPGPQSGPPARAGATVDHRLQGVFTATGKVGVQLQVAPC